MSDDLIKRLQDAANGPYDMTPICAELLEAITRIKELERERDEWRKDSAAAWDKCEERRIAQEAAEGKLAKAIAYLEKISRHANRSCSAIAARALAELEAAAEYVRADLVDHAAIRKTAIEDALVAARQELVDGAYIYRGSHQEKPSNMLFVAERMVSKAINSLIGEKNE
jgi:hypothetical protein